MGVPVGPGPREKLHSFVNPRATIHHDTTLDEQAFSPFRTRVPAITRITSADMVFPTIHNSFDGTAGLSFYTIDCVLID